VSEARESCFVGNALVRHVGAPSGGGSGRRRPATAGWSTAVAGGPAFAGRGGNYFPRLWTCTAYYLFRALPLSAQLSVSTSRSSRSRAASSSFACSESRRSRAPASSTSDRLHASHRPSCRLYLLAFGGR